LHFFKNNLMLFNLEFFLKNFIRQ